MKRLYILLLVLATLVSGMSARDRINFDKGWRFALVDSVQMSSPEYDDAGWRLLNVPHDWAIEGDFSA